MVSTLGSGEQLNQTCATSHILVANDSEIWRKYQSLMDQNARDGAYFSPGGHFNKRKGHKDAEAAKKNVFMVYFESDFMQGGSGISHNPPDVIWCNTLRYCTLCSTCQAD